MTLTAIRLDEKTFPNYKTLEEDNALTNLSRINIFIGANNAGKSRLMRTIFGNNGFSYQRKESDLGELNNLIHQFQDEISSAATRQTGGEITFPKLINLAKYKYLNYGESFNQERIEITNFLKSLVLPITINNRQGTYGRRANNQQDSVNIAFKSFEVSYLNLIQKLEAGNTRFVKTYIPILRGLRPIQENYGEGDPFMQTNNYRKRTIFDYFKDEKESNELSMSTGLDFYRILNEHKRAFDDNKQVLIEEFEKFLGDTFFQGKRIQITAVINKDVVNFKIGNSESRPIYELGDGIQAIILLTYPLFLNKGKEMIFFFEEPETHLHPGFQRIFIETLLREEFSSFQYFFTTHSNHFLDITLDHDNISIYSFHKEKGDGNQFSIENVKSGDNNVLEQIGVKNASVFLSNCTIWVEGISDRIYIRKFLEVFMKSKYNTEGVTYREDYHYSFVEYSGNNITHWSFLDGTDAEHRNINVNAICNRLFLVTDQDGAGELDEDGEESKTTKRERQEKLKNKLGVENYHCLDCREIENALSHDVLKKVIEGRIKKKKEKTEIPYNGDWSFKEYQHAKLGDFIKDNIETEYYKNKLNKIDSKGTIYDKIGFAKAAVAAIKFYDDLSEPAKVLTEKIYAFIKKNNQ